MFSGDEWGTCFKMDTNVALCGLHTELHGECGQASQGES